MTSIFNQILEHASFLTQSIYRQQAHRHVSSSISTNSELIKQIIDARLSINQIHLLTADTQSAGRGQSGRSWQSPKGNVYLSLYYPSHHPQLPLNQPISGLLSLCVGYFLAQLPIIQQINALRRKTDLDPIGVKWANDIGFYTERSQSSQTTYSDNPTFLFQKLSGILIEPVIDKGAMFGLVVGVGLNVNNAPKLTRKTQEGMSYQSISLSDLISQQQSLQGIEHNPTSITTLPKVSDMYLPMSKAIFQAILYHQEISKNPKELQNFLIEFNTVNILKDRRISVMQDSIPSTKTAVDLTHKKIGKVIGVDGFGCLQLKEAKTDSDLLNSQNKTNDESKVHRLFAGKIEMLS